MSNDNRSTSFNNFVELPLLPYKVIEVMLKDKSQETEDLWKVLKYTDIDCLDKPNLTLKQKKEMIWKGESEEQFFNVFLKPMVGSSMDDTNAQTQIRLYRYNTMPTNKISAIVCFEIDLITNETTSLIRKDGLLMERTDYMESLFLNFMNGRDIQIGSGFFSFDRELSRSCNSQLNIGNSKSFYGRSLIMGLRFSNIESGVECG